MPYKSYILKDQRRKNAIDWKVKRRIIVLLDLGTTFKLDVRFHSKQEKNDPLKFVKNQNEVDSQYANIIFLFSLQSLQHEFFFPNFLTLFSFLDRLSLIRASTLLKTPFSTPFREILPWHSTYTFRHFENYLRFLISFIMIIRSVLNTKSQVCAEEADNERWKVEGSGRGVARRR